MRRWKKILASVVAVVVVAVAALMASSAYDAGCPTAQPAAVQTPQTMRAVRSPCYGSTDVLRIETVARPVPTDDEVLVRVHAAGVNPLDWHYMTGTPYIMRLTTGFGRPDSTLVGVDFAGTVEAVGSQVQRFQPGDRVFGARDGAYAEYIVVRESRNIVHIPDNIDFAEAAAVPVAAVTALQAIRDAGRVQPGQRVLVNGASGGVGTFAVQIGKAYGAHVTGVSSARNSELVLSLGADRAIDYALEDFTRGKERYDVIIDNVGNHSLRALRRALEPDGIVVLVTGPKRNPWLGPISRVVWAKLTQPFVSQTQQWLLAELRPDDLTELAGMMESGTLSVVIDQRFALDDASAAIDYLAQGRTRGKSVIVVRP